MLYDRQLVDDELYALWARFAAGVRILVFSDSCHSGSVDAGHLRRRRAARRRARDGRHARASDEGRCRATCSRATYDANRALYDGIQQAVPSGDAAEVAATVILVSGCQDNQLSLDGDRNGLFTQQLLARLGRGPLEGVVPSIPQGDRRADAADAEPELLRRRRGEPAFERQTPLTV